MDQQPANGAPETPWQFKPGGQPAGPDPAANGSASPSSVPGGNSDPVNPEGTDLDTGAITWQASEFIAHNKSVGWYLLLALGALLLAAGDYFITKDKTSTAVIIVAAIVFGAYGARKPRQLEYTLDDEGLTIGDKLYSYDRFRFFSVIEEGAFSSIVFAPLGRFDPPVTIYYDPKDESAIAGLLSTRLPMQEAQHDMMDRFIRKIHF